jgi:hypothetical protein
VTATFKTGVGGPPSTKPTCSLAVVTAHVTSRGSRGKPKSGQLMLRISCDQSAAVTVAGALTERLTKHKSKLFRLKTVHASLAGGREYTFVVKLPAGAFKGLKRHRHESVVFTLVAANSGGQGSVTARVGRLRF